MCDYQNWNNYSGGMLLNITYWFLNGLKPQTEEQLGGFQGDFKPNRPTTDIFSMQHTFIKKYRNSGL